MTDSTPTLRVDPLPHEYAPTCACHLCMNERLARLINVCNPTPATMADLDNAVFTRILDCTQAFVEGGETELVSLLDEILDDVRAGVAT